MAVLARSNLRPFPRPVCASADRTWMVETTRFVSRTEQTCRASRYGLGDLTRMDTSNLSESNKREPSKGPQPSANRPGKATVRTAKGPRNRTQRTAEIARSQQKAVAKEKTKAQKLVCRYCGSDDLAPSFIKRRDRRCRKCFSKRYSASAQTRQTKVKK
jgi:hypothetical protein